MHETSPAGQATVQEVLEERARSLSRSSHVEGDAPGTTELVVLEVGAERYGVDAGRVLEVRHLVKLAPVPGTPPFWAGIVSIRGTLHPVLDLQRYLQLGPEGPPFGSAGEGPVPPGAPKGDPKKVVLVAGGAFQAGLMVDEAAGVRRVPAAAIDPPVAGASETMREAMRGVTADALTILDVDALLSDPRLVVKETRT